MKTLTIDKIRPYLEKGCELSLATNQITNKRVGSLMVVSNDKINGIEEVEIDEFIRFFPNIKRILKYRICILRYDVQKGKIINQVKRQVYSGPYNEESYYQTVDGLEVEADDIFSSFIYQEENIKNYAENKENVENKERKL